jgi:hypothetical protein
MFTKWYSKICIISIIVFVLSFICGIFIISQYQDILHRASGLYQPPYSPITTIANEYDLSLKALGLENNFYYKSFLPEITSLISWIEGISIIVFILSLIMYIISKLKKRKKK